MIMKLGHLKGDFMENDDKPVGLILSRRDALKLLGVGSAAFLAACAAPEVTSTLIPTLNPTVASTIPPTIAPTVAAAFTQAPSVTTEVLSCVVRPELTIGPYFVDEQINRSDIRSEPSDGLVKEGIPLTLAIGVYDVSQNSCNPLEGAQVDIWHCDALGIYSGVSDQGFNTVGQKFLRGYQLTDGTGKAQFTTVYPGWYSGRTVHIHFMIRTIGADSQNYEFVSQFFFDEALSDQVYSVQPYASKGQRNTFNASDNIFNNGGNQLLLDISGDNTSGYTAAINIGLDLTDTEVGASSSFGGLGGGPP
jgi:protocatechuate 3,4-dioxygenase beta subunit